MSEYAEPSDNIEECDCSNCKNIFWVPYYDGCPDMGHPQFRPFCGTEFGWIEEIA
jgi:hypothetical protein